MPKHQIFTEPDFELLEGVARELGVELTLDRSIRESQGLFEQGIRPPGTEDGHTPKEMAYLAQILPAVVKQRTLPAMLSIYLADRGFVNLPETVPTTVKREKDKALGNLIEGVEQLSQAVSREQER